MLHLKKASEEDEQEIKELYERSEAIHRPWTYPPKDYKKYLNEEGRYFLCLDETKSIVGTFNVSGVVRGYFQSGYLGYEVYEPYSRKGYMRVGIGLLIEEAFGSLNLHRLEANIQPDNIASIKLVMGAGFIKEGFSKNYLNIGGKGWKDHERWALVNENWRENNS